MQPRLTRSRTDSMIAGVCGGLAEYLRIDPVLTRLIFVLITLTSGLGLVIYPVLWLIIPRAPARTPAPPMPQPPGNTALPQIPADAQADPMAARQPYPEYQAMYQQMPPQSSGRTAGPLPYAEVPPEQYRFDPQTGRSIGGAPNLGQTISLGREPDNALMPPQQPSGAYSPPPAAPKPVSPMRRVSWFGVTLIGMGLLFLAERFGIDTAIVFPALMIGIGLFLLLRKQ